MDKIVPNAEEKALFDSSRRIEAIKAVRARTGCGLYEARQALDVDYKPTTKIVVTVTRGKADDIRQAIRQLKDVVSVE